MDNASVYAIWRVAFAILEIVFVALNFIKLKKYI